MEELEKKVRTEERLKIKIGEAKNLQCRTHGSASQRDVYCAVALDQEEIFRTTTMEKTLCPFFGEEFQFEVPRPFRYLSIYVYDRDRHLKQDKVLGKVAIKREDLNSYHNKDHWFPIRPVDADSEVQGKANIELKYEPVLNKNMSLTTNFLSIKVIECFDLTLKNRCCDSYAAVTVTYSNGRKQTKRTKVKKKTTCPRFDEVFVFESSDYKSDNRASDSVSGAGYVVSPVGEADAYEVNVALWHDTGMGGDDLFLGEVRIPLRSNTQQIRSANAWYYLQPRKSKERGAMRKASCSTPPGSRLSTDNSLGSLRLQVHYIADYIFPTKSYDRLRNLLLQSIQMQPITSSAVYVLGEIVSSKMEAAQPVVRVFMHHGQIIPIIRLLATYEISKLTDPTTIFRGNTLVSKMMDETMRLSGLHYLHKTLRPAMDLIFNEKKPCEIDPTRVKDPATIEINLSNLIEYVNKVFEAITQSAVYCPSLMCQIFHNLKECAMIYFPQNKEVRYSVISGFIFLRFFAPAILGPRLFDLTTEQIDSQTNRTLTLISKTIQSLGNLVSARNTCMDEAANSSVLVHPSCKEEYMERVHKAVATPAHIQAIRQFLEIISASSRNPGERGGPIDTPVLLKEGVMIKRAQGRNRFGRKNFKQRYFRLTTHDLTYSKNKGKDPLCTIPLSDILAVERLTEESFKKKNMFQVVQRERALYVQAGNCVEQKEWVDLLTKLCGNAGRLESYHPGAYINQHWLCCKTSGEHSAGCTQVSKCSSDFDWSGLPRTCTIDEERELERIHSLVVSHMQRLDVLLAQMCECTAAAESKDTATSTEGCISVRRDMKSSDTSTLVKNYDIDVCFMPAEWVVEDVHSCLKTLSQLRDVTCALEKEHRTYLRALARETKYGSKQAPIGDDNYLHLAARMNFDQSIPRRCLDT